MRIYTGRGDAGRTDLRAGDRVSKASPRIEAYGTVDELNALVGRVRPTGEDDVDEHLRAVQNHLHVVQAELADPAAAGRDDEDDGADSGDDDAPRVTAAHVDRLEAWMDAYDAELDPLTGFVLPGGCRAGADLHHARTVCRRAERRVVALADAASVADPLLAYLNRLSDALFVFARVVNRRADVPEEHPTY